jgi:putative transposase
VPEAGSRTDAGAIYPKPRLRENRENHRKYQYLLNNFKVEEPRQVRAADITYIPMREGFMYLATTLDWYSRYVVSWKLSNSLESLRWTPTIGQFFTVF